VILGEITPDLEAIVPLRIFGPDGLSLTADVTIDTGFTGYLTLPAEIVERLGLALAETDDYILADGAVVALPVYYASLAWDEATRDVLALQTDAEPLIGMALLHGQFLGMEIADGGTVRIEDLNSTDEQG
jgi:clan AA aspartic protease